MTSIVLRNQSSFDGSTLVTNRKALILHEQNIDPPIDHSKSLNGGSATHTVLTEFDDQRLLSRGMASIKSSASYVS